MVFGHVPKQDQPFFIENIIASVKPGGHVLFEVYSEAQLDYQTGGPPSVDMLYHPETVLSWVDPYKCLHFYYGEAERHEGKRHHGRCHVIQDRKSTRLNSSHVASSYAVFCLKKKKKRT